jgi:hypothetical protein
LAALLGRGEGAGLADGTGLGDGVGLGDGDKDGDGDADGVDDGEDGPGVDSVAVDDDALASAGGAMTFPHPQRTIHPRGITSFKTVLISLFMVLISARFLKQWNVPGHVEVLDGGSQ